MKKTKSKSYWQVDLGEEHWKRLTHAGWEEQGLRLLGRISRQGQFGALAVASDGSYLQINGDHVTPINRSQVEYALRIATKKMARVQSQQRAREPRPATVVSFKRRRVFSVTDSSS